MQVTFVFVNLRIIIIVAMSVRAAIIMYIVTVSLVKLPNIQMKSIDFCAHAHILNYYLQSNHLRP